MNPSAQHFDLVVAGTGVSSSFFVKAYRERFGETKKVLFLERGQKRPLAEMLQKGDWCDVEANEVATEQGPTDALPKLWAVRPSFGGNANYWIGNTPRFVPSDFETQTLYGVGMDWPISYRDLEADYCTAEELMGIAGSETIGRVSPRSKPYPMPPHRLSRPDEILMKAHPDHFFPLPSARASVHSSRRNACCASAICMFCPVDAKFRVANEWEDYFESDGNALLLGAEVHRLEMGPDGAQALIYKKDGQEHRVTADLFALGTNPIFNTAILLRSGDESPRLGRGLMDHPSYRAVCLLDGVDNFQGGTFETGIHYLLYDGPHRKTQAGCIFFTSNAPMLRPEFGRWRQVMRIEINFDDLPLDSNYVDVDAKTDKARIHYGKPSAYTQAGRDHLLAGLERALSPLPIEDINVPDEPSPAGAAHIMGTHRMGSDPATSVVDANCVHHKYRNVVLLGGGNFVTPSAVNPTLTMAALALRAGRLL